MDGKNVNQRGTSLNQPPRLEEDGIALGEHAPRENVAVIFFRRVGRAFADFGDMISRAFSNLGESFREAFAHVSNAIRGVDSGTALRNVTVARSDYPTIPIDFDTDDESGAEDLIVDDGNLGIKSPTENEAEVPRDFSENISPSVSRKSAEKLPSPEVSEHESMLNSPLNDDDSKVEIEAPSDEIAAPQNTSGERSFNSFHGLDANKKTIEFLSLGSEYMQRDCLGFAQEIVKNTMAIESGAKAEFTQTMLDSANALLKMKRQFDSDEQNRIKKEEFLRQQEIIGKEKSSMGPGEWDFEEFFKDFVSHQSERKKFILVETGKYFTSPELLTFAKQVESNKDESFQRKQAATYLILWNLNPSHAEKIADEAIGFSLVTLPPPPPAPPRRTAAAPKVEPVPVAPEQVAITLLVNADGRRQEKLRDLINIGESTFQSGLKVLSTIWQPESSSSGSTKNTALAQLEKSNAVYGAYTDLEEVDNAINWIEKIAELKTGHKIKLSGAIALIKSQYETIINNLKQMRYKIIETRKISDVADLDGDQIVRGQQLFATFLDTYIPSRKRDDLDKFLIRDIYFTDECISYVSSVHQTLSPVIGLHDKDKESLEAAGYLLNKYNQFKLRAGGSAA